MAAWGMQVVHVDDDTYRLDDRELRNILLGDDVKDLPVVVVSVAGAYRGGKSFLLNFFLRYLTAPLASQLDGSWIGGDHDPLAGFSWRGGSQRNTIGIVMWSQPIITTLGSGEKAAVILMDTQGTYDSFSTLRDCSTIFALSTLLSSVQIYNIPQNIREDDLQSLQLFTEYGKLLKDKSGKAYQELMFLVRDWQNPAERPFGSSGGKMYLEEKLNVIDQHMPQEVQDLREHILDCFTSVSCFLLPHPGFAIMSPEFDGKNIDINPDFLMHVQQLTTHVFGPGRLTPKEISGQKVKASDLYNYFTTYMTVFNSDQIPTPISVMTATVEAGLMSAFEEARRIYEAGMEENYGSATYVAEHDLNELHEMSACNAVEFFTETKKMGSKASIDIYLNKLMEEMERRLSWYAELNKKRAQTAIMAAKEAYDSKIGEISADLCIHPLDLEEMHHDALQAAIQLFDENRKCLSNKQDTERENFIESFAQQYELLLRINEQNNTMAVTEMCLEYRQLMQNACSTEPALSEVKFLAVHTKAKEEALQHFDNIKRKHPNIQDKDEFKENLVQMINNYFEAMEAINSNKIMKARQAGVEAYDEYMKSAWDASKVCLHPEDLDKEHSVGKGLALAAFNPNNGSSGNVGTTDEDESMSEILNERYNHYKDLNDEANEAAVLTACNNYKAGMSRLCRAPFRWFNPAPALVGVIFKDNLHEGYQQAAYNEFYKKRRDNENKSYDCFFDKLEKPEDVHC